MTTNEARISFPAIQVFVSGEHRGFYWVHRDQESLCFATWRGTKDRCESRAVVDSYRLFDESGCCWRVESVELQHLPWWRLLWIRLTNGSIRVKKHLSLEASSVDVEYLRNLLLKEVWRRHSTCGEDADELIRRFFRATTVAEIIEVLE